MKTVVTELTKTGASCPAEWTGRTSDGRFVYVRYRGGCLRVGFGQSPAAAVESAMYTEDRAFRRVDPDSFHLVVGQPYDGSLNDQQLIDLTRDRVEWPGQT